MSVIVPVFGRADCLDRGLAALDAQTRPADRYEVIAVDNETKGDLGSLADGRQRIRVVREEIPSSYAARNRGIEEARGEIIGFTDADCIPDPEWIERGVARLTGTERCGIVAGRVELFFRDPERPTSVELYESVAAFRQREYVERWSFGATANVFTSREAIEKVGRFDDQLKSLGDLDWGRRVAEAGYRLVYAEEVRARHPARRSLSEFRRRSVRMTGGFRDLAAKKRYGVGRLLRNASLGLVPLRHLVGIGPNDGLRGPVQRIRVASVLTYLIAVRSLVLVRLLLGGRSGR